MSAKRPRAFLFENVKGLTTQKHKHTLFDLILKFEELGYSVAHRVLNFWDWGVAQTRERLILVGIRRERECSAKLSFLLSQLRDTVKNLRATKDSKARKKLIKEGDRILEQLVQTHETDELSAYMWPLSEFEETGYRPVLIDAIGDLPEPGTPLSEAALAYLERDPRPLKKHRPPRMDEPCSTITANYRKGVPYGLFYPNHVGGVETKSYPGHTPSFIHGPAKTIKAGVHGVPGGENCFQSELGHGKPRRFTVRECCRIQSVPDSYIFPDEISITAMYKIIGNGVPPRPAYHLAVALASQLNNTKCA